MAEIDPVSSESGLSGVATETSSNVASLSSTPPTSASPDSISLASDPEISKLTVAATVSVAASSSAELRECQSSWDKGMDQTREQSQQRGQHLSEEARGTEQQEQHGPLQPERAGHSDFAATSNSPLLAPLAVPDTAPAPATERETPVASAIVVATQDSPVQTPPTSRSRRVRAGQPVYNLAQLSGTDIHGKRRGRSNGAQDSRRHTVSGLVAAAGRDGNGDPPAVDTDPLVRKSIDALNLDWSLPSTPRRERLARGTTKPSPKKEPTARRMTRLSTGPVQALTTKVSSLGKRGRKTLEQGASRLSRELRRLQDTDEFAHIDSRPVVHTVWSNGRFVDPRTVDDAAPPPSKRLRAADCPVSDEQDGEEEREHQKAGLMQRNARVKAWLDKGLYAGQECPPSKGLTALERKRLARIPELVSESDSVAKPRKILPLPMFNGLRLLINGRDFKLPYDVCNPLPPGQPKPTGYRSMTKNRFIGPAAAYWKKTPHFKDFQSKCVCEPEDGCADQCQNRIMLYECDETNCNVGKAYCSNRAFQNLQERTKQGGRYRVGVEVVKTADRGYGVRTNRCFEPNQIIMEYTGEIITENECERRMNEVYKDNECYYLMSFDQNMIIDATTGSSARFVNHSCSPNCRMIKWIVSGQPRMALFAGDRPIMTGEELTYDYNFDPFSAKNVQKCLCGSDNCRGVLGPKSRETKPSKASKDEPISKKVPKGTVKNGKRKLKELLSGDVDKNAGHENYEPSSQPNKKRKIGKSGSASSPLAEKAVKRSLSSSSLKVAKTAAGAIKRSVSTISLNAKSALGSRKSGSQSSSLRRTSTGAVKTYAGSKARDGVIRTTKAAIAVASSGPGGLATAKAFGRKGNGTHPATSSLRAGDGNKRTPSKKAPLAQKAVTPGQKKASPAKKTSPLSNRKITKAKHYRSSMITVKTPAAAPSPRKRVPSRKVLEASSPDGDASLEDSIQASPQISSPKPRKALELSRAAKVRLVEATD